jgi:murein DD-endopeptidase MepM/ murein hydrolase activator NlpD
MSNPDGRPPLVPRYAPRPGQRMMARRRRRPARRWAELALAVAALVAGVVAVVAVSGTLAPARSPAASTAGSPRASDGSAQGPTPSSTQAGSPSTQPTPPSTSRPTPAATPTAPPVPTPSPRPTRPPNAAPDSAADFDLVAQVIDIGFPLRADARYRYRDRFLARRPGPPDPYNHARVNADGRLVRLHDGIDIYARAGEEVLAPFSGVVIDPATRWQPWEEGRYGLSVVILSEEPASAGYMALMVHLEERRVEVGDRVERGQVVGALGGTGNAENVHPQLHFELRAPFMLDWSALGEDRRVDAFNPYPSLVRADPNR